jgi:hypothetical protein
VEHEPWLKQDSLLQESQRLLSLVSHDEDSRVSRNEFISSFETFMTSDIITLVVNLLRAGMVAKVPRLCYVYNAHDPYLNGQVEQNGVQGGIPEKSPDPGAHHALSVSDTPAQTMMMPGQHRVEAEKRELNKRIRVLYGCTQPSHRSLLPFPFSRFLPP